MPEADPITAALAQTRELIAERDKVIARSAAGAVDVREFNAAQDRLAERVPWLQAALEAAMRFHAPQVSADGTRFCAFCSCAEGQAVASPCPEAQAIARELLGEEHER